MPAELLRAEAASDGRRRDSTILLVVGLVLVVGLALLLRLPGLTDKPLHSDEGVNGWFTLRLYWWNVYRYNPADYHGPFLYYQNLVWFWLLGPTDFSLRFGTALWGSLLPLTLLPLRRHLGSLGIVLAGLLIACSPTSVYFSRTVIHEVYLVFATALGFAAVCRYVARPAVRWAAITGLTIGLAFANKETTVLSLGSVAVGFGLAWALGRSRPGDNRERDPDLFGGRSRFEALRVPLVANWRAMAVGLAVGVGTLVLFFSSFFSWPRGLLSFFEAYGPWLEHGVGGRNQAKPWHYFAEMLAGVESEVLVLAVAAMILAGLRRHRFGLLLTGWALASLAVYSVLPYKTPWCVLNIELPLFLLAGWWAHRGALAATNPGLRPGFRALGVVVVVLPLFAAGPLMKQSREVNANGYDDESHDYVFVQTQRGYYEFLQDLFGIGDDERFQRTGGPRVVNVDPKNPTRWYTITRGWHYDKRQYLNGAKPRSKQVKSAHIVLAVKRNLKETARRVRKSRGEWHREVYTLRPGRRLTAWYRKDLWEAYQERGGRASSPWPRSESDAIHRPPVPARFR